MIAVVRRSAPCTFAVLCFVLALTGCGHKNGLVPPVNSPEATQYLTIINQQAAANGVPRNLILAIVSVESGGNPSAVGPSGSLGLMQLKAATARQYGASNALDPASNIAAGARYLHALLTRYHGSVTLAVAAFNAGPRAVDNAHGVPPQSRAYVQRVMNVYEAMPC
jgi:soluble lytic murein transglycosylase-like protein